MKKISLLYYAVALFAPIIYFTVLTDNSNEKHPIIPWIVCPLLFAIAGWLSSAGFVMKARFKWVIASIIAGLVEAFLLTAGV